jgi:hypothetical protein
VLIVDGARIAPPRRPANLFMIASFAPQARVSVMRTSVLPTSWRPSPTALLPADPTVYEGPRLAFWGAIAWLLVITTRSLIHLLLPDGGAHSIATIDIAVAGGSDIVALFGQWGASQLLLAVLLWALLLRWRGTLPLVLVVFSAEPCLRGLAGHLKPLTTEGTPPGGALNWVVLPGLLILLWLSLCPAERDVTRS